MLHASFRRGWNPTLNINLASLLEERRGQDVRHPILWHNFFGQWLRIVRVIHRRSTPLGPWMVESTELLPGATLQVKIPTHYSTEIIRMVQLLLRAVRVRTPQSQRAPLKVGEPTVLFTPVGTRLGTVTDRWHSPHVLIRVRIHATLPVVLGSNGTPQCLEFSREENVSQGGRLVRFFLDGKQRCGSFLSRVRKSTSCTASALMDVGVRGAEAVLL
mmetsp:Transcript_6383/g.17789  ORF Transcript_6383/g.17789 Transcript_6383/m.17789 type:complete len:216 (-) Transcript_6383:761-1408(-)